MAEGDFPKIDGDILFASEVNKFNEGIIQIYTGAGFDSSRNGNTAPGIEESSFELNAVTSAGNDFINISITGAFDSSFGADIGRVELKAQIKETGGAYSDILPYAIIVNSDQPNKRYELILTHRIVGTLTAGQKANGFQIKVFSRSTGISPSSTNFGSYTNIQTIQELA